MTPIQEPSAQAAGLDSAALLRMVAEAGAEVSERMLETFRAQGLVPHPQRTGYRGRAPIWHYPPGTDRQLVSLLRWRKQTKDPHLLTVLLWLDGFPVPARQVRDALTAHLQAMNETVQRLISQQAQRLGIDPADDTARSLAVDELARMVAAKRGGTPIPRRSRVRADDRSHAVALIIRVFGLGETVQGTAAEGEAVERVLGIAPNGRRHSIADAGPWLTGPPEDLFGAAGIVGLPRLIDAVTAASDAEMAAARQTVLALFCHLPLFARMIDVLIGQDDYAGLAAMRQMDRNPEVVFWLVPAVIAMLRAGWNENLAAITTALQPFPELAERARGIPDLPAAAIEANLAGKPAHVREQVQRLIDAAIDGQFDEGEPE